MVATLASTRSKRRNFGTATPEINITPLVDVVLVLLIIFMVIAPALNEGAPIDLPKVATPDPKARDINPITVLVLNDGNTLVNNVPTARAELLAKLTDAHRLDPNRSLLLKGDGKTDYRVIREVFASVQDVGWKGILLKVTEQRPVGSSS
jgi:biopolymer transport protein ExbD